MPCYSRIKTQLTDPARIMDALKAVGYEAEQADNGTITGVKDGSRIVFGKGAGGYLAIGDTANLVGISRKYAEIGVRAFARKNGYAIAEATGQKMVLVNRRG